MTKPSTILTLLLALTFFVSCRQNVNSNSADKFLNFLNNYQVDSLQILVADNFELTRTYTKYKNDKKSFLENYVTNSKVFKGKYKILKKTQNGKDIDYEVEDQSDYMKYLKIDYPKWKIKISANSQNNIERMIIDTTSNYKRYLTQLEQKSKQFKKWIEQKYPTEYLDDIYTNEGRLMPLLKEYSRRK